MSIESFQGGTIYTNEDTHVVRILTLRAAMRLQLRGIQAFRGVPSIIARVKKEFGLTGSHRSVYEQFCTMHQLPVEGETTLSCLTSKSSPSNDSGA